MELFLILLGSLAEPPSPKVPLGVPPPPLPPPGPTLGTTSQGEGLNVPPRHSYLEGNEIAGRFMICVLLGFV